MILEFAQAEPASWSDYLRDAGLLGGALLAVWALLTERLVPGGMHRRQILEERGRTDEWKGVAIGALDRIERAIEVAKSAGR